MKKKYLFVEGLDDCIVISNLCTERNIPNTFEVIKCNSKDNVLSRFDLEINEQASKNEIIGIVVDADTNAKSTWERVKSKIILTSAYDNVPEMIPIDGLIVEPNSLTHPKIGVWIMPDNNINGILEDFVRLLAHPDDILMIASYNL
jgi:hypothetical protein